MSNALLVDNTQGPEPIKVEFSDRNHEIDVETALLGTMQSNGPLFDGDMVKTVKNEFQNDLNALIVPDLNAGEIDVIQKPNGLNTDQLKDKLRGISSSATADPNHRDDGDDCVVDSTQPTLKDEVDLNGGACTDEPAEPDPLNGHEEFGELPSSTDDKPYKCHICGKLFSRNSSLKCHIRLHLEGPENILRSGSASGVAPLNDSRVAPEETRNGDDTPRRRDTADEDAPYGCIFCDKRFSRKSGLKCHIQFHVKAFQAERCNGDDDDAAAAAAVVADDKQTPRRESSSDAEASPHSQPGKAYTCVICDQRFSRKSSLIMHYRNHPIPKMTPEEEEHQHAADQCCRKFSIDIVKEEHVDRYEERRRSGPPTPSKGGDPLEEGADGEDKQYKCYICDKLFARHSSLQWHIQFHESHMYSKAKKTSDVCSENGVKYVNESFVDEDENRCNLCNKTYHSLASLKRHMTYHGKEVQFVNVDMNSEEAASSSSSSGLKDATCDLCGRSFINTTSLKKHFSQIHRGLQMRPVAEEPPPPVDVLEEANGEFQCDLCERSYHAMSSLKRHTLTAHKPAAVVDEPTTSDESGQYRCEQCSKVFHSARAKNIHMAHLHRAVAVKKFVHLVQNKSAIDSAIMEGGNGATANISYVANADGLYECHLCDRTFDRKKGLSRHIGYHNTDHSTDGRPEEYGDDLPDDSSDIDLTLEEDDDDDDDDDEEEEVDAGEDVFDCPFCDRVFENKKGLSRHIGYHNSFSSQLGDRRGASPQSDEQPDASGVDEAEEREQWECATCGRTFDSKRARSIHAVQAHKPVDGTTAAPQAKDVDYDSMFRCVYCDRYFDSGRAMNIHAAAKHAEQVTAAKAVAEVHCDAFQCSLCERTFDSARAMNIHVSAQHKSESQDAGQYCCDVCDKSFASKRSLTEHAASQCGSGTGTTPGDKVWYSCKECPKVFAHPKSVSRHLREHKQERERAAELAAAAAVASGVDGEDPIKDAAGYATSEDELKCGLCAKSFINVKALAGHMKVHKGVSADPSYSDVGDAATELEEGQKSFKCRICDKTFPSGVGLGGHMRFHSAAAARKAAAENGQPSEPATVASSASTTTTTPLVKEESVVGANEEAEEYLCDLCKQTFYRKQDLGKHIRGHMAGTIGVEDVVSDGPKCQACQRVFCGEKSLKTHLYRYHRELIQMKRPSKTEPPTPKINGLDSRVVYDDESYRCDRCDQSFTNHRAFKSHAAFNCLVGRKRPRFVDPTERALSDEQFKCEFCEQSFVLQCHLQKHLKSRCNAVDLKHDLTIEQDDGDSPLPRKRARRSTFVSPLYEYEPIGSHRCDECGKCFNSRHSLHRHALTHKTVVARADADAATKLTFSFRRNGESAPRRQANLEAQFRDMPYECVYCERCFKDKELLLEHVRMHAEANELEGDELDDDDINFHAGEHFVVENGDGDEEHFIFEQHDDHDGYQCNECNDTYNDKLQMIIHMTHHLNSKLPRGQQKSLVIRADATLLAPYKCRFCDERFINKRYRVSHLSRYHRDDIFQCDVCKKLFLWKANLRFHCRQHVVDTRHRCEYCRKYFTSKWFLKRHTKRHCVKKLVQELRESHLAAATTTVTSPVPVSESAQESVLESAIEPVLESALEPVLESAPRPVSNDRCDLCAMVFCNKESLEVHARTHAASSDENNV